MPRAAGSKRRTIGAMKRYIHRQAIMRGIMIIQIQRHILSGGRNLTRSVYTRWQEMWKSVVRIGMDNIYQK